MEKIFKKYESLVNNIKHQISFIDDYYAFDFKHLKETLVQLEELQNIILEKNLKLLTNEMVGKYVIIDLRNMNFMQNKDNNICLYDTEKEACEVCGIYEFENAWVMKLCHNHIEPE